MGVHSRCGSMYILACDCTQCVDPIYCDVSTHTPWWSYRNFDISVTVNNLNLKADHGVWQQNNTIHVNFPVALNTWLLCVYYSSQGFSRINIFSTSSSIRTSKRAMRSKCWTASIHYFMRLSQHISCLIFRETIGLSGGFADSPGCYEHTVVQWMAFMNAITHSQPILTRYKQCHMVGKGRQIVTLMASCLI